MKRLASISLTALFSLVLGLIILVPIISKGAQLAGNNPDKYSEVAEIINSIELATPEKASKYSLRLDEEDLFLFFSVGTGPLLLEYTGPDDYENITFARPEECVDQSCICYCKAGPYWTTDDEAPYLKSRVINPAAESYTCPGMRCEVQEGQYHYVNSRGSEAYYDAVAERRSEGWFEDNPGSNLYVPIPLDIITLLQTSVVDDIGAGLHEDPFFGNTGISYSSRGQFLSYLDLLLQEYRWSGGFALGGYGSAATRKQFRQKELNVPPVTLRTERYENNLIGICLYSDCLFENEKDLFLIEQRNEETKRLIKQRFASLKLAFNEMGDCLAQGQDTQDDCVPDDPITRVFRLVEENPAVTMKMVFEEDPQDNEDGRITQVSLFIDGSLYDTHQVAAPFICSSQGQQIIERPLSLTTLIFSDVDVIERSVYGAHVGSDIETCVLRIPTTE